MLDLVVSLLHCLRQKNEGCDATVTTYREQGRDVLKVAMELGFPQNYIQDPELILFAASCFLVKWDQQDEIEELVQNVLKAYSLLSGLFCQNDI